MSVRSEQALLAGSVISFPLGGVGAVFFGGQALHSPDSAIYKGAFALSVALFAVSAAVAIKSAYYLSQNKPTKPYQGPY